MNRIQPHHVLVRVNPRANPKDRARTRVLSDDESVRFGLCSPTLAPSAPWSRCCCLTAQRRDEVAHMSRREIGGGEIWTIPADRYKTKGRQQDAHQRHYRTGFPSRLELQVRRSGECRSLSDFGSTTKAPEPPGPSSCVPVTNDSVEVGVLYRARWVAKFFLRRD
jgi:hypothetical protein